MKVGFVGWRLVVELSLVWGQRLSRGQSLCRKATALKKAAEDDPKAYVRINAAQSLGLLVGEPATPYLEGLVQRAANTSLAPPHLLEGMRTALEGAKEAGRGPLALAWK